MRAAQAAQRTRPPQARGEQQKKQEYLRNMMLLKVEELRGKQGWAPMTDDERMFASDKVTKLLRTGKVTSADLRLIATESYTHVAPKGIRAAGASDITTQVSRAKSSRTGGSQVKHGRRAEAASGIAGGSAVGKSEVSTYSAHLQHHPGHRATKTKQLIDDSETDLWAKMCYDEVEEWTMETMKQRQQKKTRMDEQRKALDEQMQAAQSAKLRQVETEKEYVQQAERQREVWRQEKKEQDDRRREIHVKEKLERDAQLKETRTRRFEEERLKKDEDLRVLRQLSDEVKMEQQEKLASRTRARQEVKNFMESNKALNAAKEKLIAQEAEMDRIHQQQHLEKLDKQEKERVDVLKKIASKQAKQANMAQQMGASMQERAAEDERRAQMEMKKKYEKLEKEEQLKGQRAQEQQEAMRRCLSEQIAEKERLRTMEIQRSTEEREQLQRELQVAEERENEQRRARKQREIDHRRDIEQQMAERQLRRPTAMTATERALNQKKLEALARKGR